MSCTDSQTSTLRSTELSQLGPEDFAPEAPIERLPLLTPESIARITESSEVKYIFELDLGDGERSTFTSYDGLVAQGDILIATVDEFITEVSILASENGINSQGAMKEQECTATDGLTGRCSRWTGRHWPGGTIPYQLFSGSYFPYAEFSQADFDAIYAAMDVIEASTGVNFIVRNGQDDYVRIIPDAEGSCSSYLGRRGGRQDLLLDPDVCFNGANNYGSVIHELGHAVGLIHEHQRPDRDAFITLTSAGQGWSQVGPTKSVETQTAYEYGSIMHYAPSYRGVTYFTYDDPAGNGSYQRDDMTALDLEAIRQRYP